MARKKGSKSGRKIRRKPSKGFSRPKESGDSSGAEEGQFDPDEATSERMISRKSLRLEMLRRLDDDGLEEALRHHALSEEDLIAGVVVKIAGAGVFVDTAGGPLRCRMRGSFKQFEMNQEHAVAVGDRVKILDAGEDEGVVVEVLERKSKLSRLDPTIKSAEKVVVANVDQVIIVASIREPKLRLRLIDRYLVACEKGELDAIICLNKIDLADGDDYRALMAPYQAVGYRVIFTSAVEQSGIDELRDTLAGRSSVLSGHSGVGKSSLLEKVQPGLKLACAPVTGYGKGKHRTTHAELIGLEVGGYVVDTPGIREFGLWRVEAGEIEAYFREIEPHVADCKFPGCTHLSEPGCAVLRALENGEISRERYESYRALFEELASRRPY